MRCLLGYVLCFEPDDYDHKSAVLPPTCLPIGPEREFFPPSNVERLHFGHAQILAQLFHASPETSSTGRRWVKVRNKREGSTELQEQPELLAALATQKMFDTDAFAKLAVSAHCVEPTSSGVA